MQDNKFNDYRIPCGMLIVFLEKALTLIHMETHLDDVSTLFHSNSLDSGVILWVAGLAIVLVRLSENSLI
jgi:hypothetical protein